MATDHPDTRYTPEQIDAAAALGITVEALSALIRDAHLADLAALVAGERTPDAQPDDKAA